MAPVVPPVPSAPPDPPTTQWGVWEKRINWIVTIIAILVSLAVALVELARSPAPTAPAVTPPATEAPIPIPAPAPASFLEDIGHGVLAVTAAVLPVGCSAAQQATWRAAGTRLGACLAQCGVAAADNAVTEWRSGETVDAADVGWKALPCVVACAGQAGAILLAGVEQTYTGGDSLGAMLSPMTRLAAPLSASSDPLEAACGSRDGPPRCIIILRDAPAGP